MTISQTISSLGTVPTTADPTNFDTNADAFLGTALPGFRTELNTFGTQANALAAAMNSIAAGTAQAIPYTFSTTTTDSDPGAGILRLDNATQASATAIRVDLLGSDATDYTDIIDGFDASTSTVTGQIRLIKVADATKWLVFNVTAVDSSTGYRNITVANVDSSGVDPFSDADALLLTFTRTGDKGDAGTGGLVPISAGTVTNQASAAITLPGGYDEYEVRIRKLAVATDGAKAWIRTSTNGGSSFDAGASDYWYVCGRNSNAIGTGTGSAADTKIVLTVDQGNATGEEYSGTLHIVLPGEAAYCQIYGNGGYGGSSVDAVVTNLNARRSSAADVDAIQFLADTGNISFRYELLGVNAP